MAKKRRGPAGGARGDGPKLTKEAGNDGAPRGLAVSRRLGRRRLYVLLGCVVALAAAAILTVVRPWGWAEGRGDVGDASLIPLPAPKLTFADDGGGASGESTSAIPVSNGDFVGAEGCASCHAAQYATWRRSTHGRAGGSPGAVAVIAPFDGTPIRFRDAVVVPASSGGKYTFTVRQRGQEEKVFRVDGVVGGGHMLGGRSLVLQHGGTRRQGVAADHSGDGARRLWRLAAGARAR